MKAIIDDHKKQKKIETLKKTEASANKSISSLADDEVGNKLMNQDLEIHLLRSDFANKELKYKSDIGRFKSQIRNLEAELRAAKLEVRVTDEGTDTEKQLKKAQDELLLAQKEIIRLKAEYQNQKLTLEKVKGDYTSLKSVYENKFQSFKFVIEGLGQESFFNSTTQKMEKAMHLLTERNRAVEAKYSDLQQSYQKALNDVKRFSSKRGEQETDEKSKEKIAALTKERDEAVESARMFQMKMGEQMMEISDLQDREFKLMKWIKKKKLKPPKLG